MKAHEILVDFAKQITTISAAIMTLFGSLIAAGIIGWANLPKTMVALSFISFGFAIVSSFWLILAIAGTFDAVSFPSRSAPSQDAGANASIYRTNIRLPLMLTCLFFLSALALLASAALSR